MLTFSLALITVPIMDMIAAVWTLPIHAIEKKIQCAGKSIAEWNALNVENPGERLRSISFVFALLSTTVTRGVAIVSAGVVFHWRGAQMSLVFLGVAGLLLFLNDAARVYRFIGNSGVWTELGYGAGGFVGLGRVLASDSCYSDLYERPGTKESPLGLTNEWSRRALARDRARLIRSRYADFHRLATFR